MKLKSIMRTLSIENKYKQFHNDNDMSIITGDSCGKLSGTGRSDFSAVTHENQAFSFFPGTTAQPVTCQSAGNSNTEKDLIDFSPK